MDEQTPEDLRETDNEVNPKSAREQADDQIAKINQRFVDEEKRLVRFVLFLLAMVLLIMAICFAWVYFTGGNLFKDGSIYHQP